MNAVCTPEMSELEFKVKDETFVFKHIVRHYRRIKHKNVILLMSSKKNENLNLLLSGMFHSGN